MLSLMETVAMAEETNKAEVVKEALLFFFKDCFDKIELGYNKEAKDITH